MSEAHFYPLADHGNRKAQIVRKIMADCASIEASADQSLIEKLEGGEN